ncbi:MAG: BTAD domain-containing putative transcriptional regulator [candidate division WOR-3 bacterium]
MDKDRIFSRIMRMIIGGGIMEPKVILNSVGVSGVEWLLLTNVQIAMVRSEPIRLLGLVKRLVSSTQDRWFRSWAYYFASWAYNVLGDAVSCEGALLVALENGFDKTSILNRFCFMDIAKEDFFTAKKRLESIQSPNMETQYIRAILEIFEGKPAQAKSILSQLIAADQKASYQGGAWELLGMAERLLGRFREAGDAFIRAVDWFAERRSRHSVFPLIEYQELVATGHAEPLDPRRARRAIALAREGGLAERSAVHEAEAMDLWINKDLRAASELFLIGGRGLAAAGASDEAFFAHLRAAYTGYLSGSDSFFRAMEYLRPRLRVYGFVDSDPIYSHFSKGILLPAVRFEHPREHTIRVRLLGGLETEGFSVSGWTSRKALTLLKYLLLNHGRGLPPYYLAYLLWPKKSERSALARLRQEIYYIRKHSGPLGMFLIYKGGLYYIREDEALWVDTTCFWRLVAEAKATDNLQKYLQALDLYRGPLLPGDLYDRFIEEHREALHREFHLALREAISLMSDMDEALALLRRFHGLFPEDSVVAKAYAELLIELGRKGEALSFYEEFKRNMWRKHRKKPDFQPEGLT